MVDHKPIIVCEPGAVEAASIATGYEIQAFPAHPNADLSDFSNRKVILWPDASEDSRVAFMKLAEKITDLCSEIRLILPNGKPHGWNITRAVTEGITWPDLAKWAKLNMIVYGRGEYPRLVVETMPAANPVTHDVQTLWTDLGLAKTANGEAVANVDNIVRILANRESFKDMVWYDEFHQRYFTTWNSRRVREWADIDDINMTVLLQRKFGLLRVREETVSAAVRYRGHELRKNEPKDWLRSLRWDGQSRMDGFFARYLGAPDTGYTAAVSRNFWIGLVARIYQPGCQLDNMVILEGKQGIYKSKSLEAIGGKWYMEASEEITSKDFFLALAGKLLIEIADLDSFSRADATRIKKVITCRIDRYRSPYGRATQDHPRQSVFVGTTNEQHYLRDSTGARRFWPIACGQIDLDAIHKDRKQLFAEAVTRYIAGEDWYKVPHDATLSEQEDRRQFDEWENLIGAFLRDSCVSETTITDIAACVGIDKGHMELMTQRRLAGILRRMGWDTTTARRHGVVSRIWVLKGAVPRPEDPHPDGQPASSNLLPAFEPSGSAPAKA